MSVLESEHRPYSLLPILEKNDRILIADDNEAIHQDFRKIFIGDVSGSDFDAAEAEVFGRMAHVTMRQFQLDFASQGQEALEMVRIATEAKQRYSVAFMDVRMPPGWNGLETTQKIWEVDPDLQIVICTAYSDKSWEAMMETVGHPERVLILKKPFDSIEVLQLAHALSEKWSLLQAAKCRTEKLERTVSLGSSALVAVSTRLASTSAVQKTTIERNREHSMLLDEVHEAIIVLDLEGAIRTWNRAAESLYGWTATEATQWNIAELLYLGIPAHEAAEARRTLEKEGTWRGQLVQKTKDGRVIKVESRWTLVRDEAGLPISFFQISSEMTGEKPLVEV